MDIECYILTFKIIIFTLIIIDVTVSISGISPREVNESSGSVQVCIEADHESREPYSINLRTSADTAIGECGNVT